MTTPSTGDAGAVKFMRGGTSRNGVAVTATEARVFDALTSEPTDPHIVAQRAQLTNVHKGEAGAKYCILLGRKGLAVRHGTRTFPKWSKAMRDE